MFFRKSKFDNELKDPNKVYIPYSGNVYSSNPGQLGWSQTAGNELIFITFKREVAINFFYLRFAPANGVVAIHGDQFGPRLQSDTINAIGLSSVGALSGAPTVQRVINGLSLSVALPIHIWNIDPWRTNSIYLSGSLAGAYSLNYSYVFV